MAAPAWLARSRADVPRGTSWLTPPERAALGRLRVPTRRADWRLGRWAVKEAVARRLGVEPAAVAILAAPGGAPEAWLDGGRAPVAVSLSHRAGRGLALVADPGAPVGCDLERIEPRSPAFASTWFSDEERALLARRRDHDEAALLANLLWSAREAATKVRREGLRLPVSSVVVRAEGAGETDGRWRPLAIAWPDGEPLAGWWRAEPGWVMTVAGVDEAPEAADAAASAATGP